jgi:hypothetical protein
MHLCAVVVYLTDPFFYKPPLPVYVLLVIELYRFLPYEMPVIAGDIQDCLHYFRDNVLGIEWQDMHLVILIYADP